MMLTARSVALRPGGFFTARSLGNARVRRQARRLPGLPKVSGQLNFRFRHVPIAAERRLAQTVKVRDGEIAIAKSPRRPLPIRVNLSAALNELFRFFLHS